MKKITTKLFVNSKSRHLIDNGEKKLIQSTIEKAFDADAIRIDREKYSDETTTLKAEVFVMNILEYNECSYTLNRLREVYPEDEYVLRLIEIIDSANK